MIGPLALQIRASHYSSNGCGHIDDSYMTSMFLHAVALFLREDHDAILN